MKKTGIKLLKDKKSGVEFTDAPEVEVMAVDLINQYHSHLAEARICYLFREGAWNKQKRETWGTAERVAGKYHHLTNFDFIVTINREIWFSNISFNKPAMEALVDHELQHCCKDEDTNGDPVFYIQGHDLEDFISIVRRHGLWSEPLRKIHKAGTDYQQLQLTFEKEERQPQAVTG